jgi:hypothetical protein
MTSRIITCGGLSGHPPINKLFGTIQNGKFYFRDSKVCCELPLRPAVADGTSVVLTVRPESVATDSPKQKLPCVIRERYSVGKDELALIEIEGQTARGFVSPTLPLFAGDRLECGFLERGVFLFDWKQGKDCYEKRPNSNACVQKKQQKMLAPFVPRSSRWRFFRRF